MTIRVKSRAATANTPRTVPTVIVAMTADSVVCPEIAILRRLGEKEAREECGNDLDGSDVEFVEAWIT
jgi:hypothetical protein